MVPSLTTMRVNIAELGAHGMRMLLDLLAGEDVGGQLAPLTPGLIVRASTGPHVAATLGGEGTCHGA